jgi:hypothetical protein
LVSGTIAATRHISDVRPFQVKTFEHQPVEKRCRRVIVLTGVFLTDVKCAVSIEPRLRSIGAYLPNVH